MIKSVNSYSLRQSVSGCILFHTSLNFRVFMYLLSVTLSVPLIKWLTLAVKMRNLEIRSYCFGREVTRFCKSTSHSTPNIAQLPVELYYSFVQDANFSKESTVFS